MFRTIYNYTFYTFRLFLVRKSLVGYKVTKENNEIVQICSKIESASQGEIIRWLDYLTKGTYECINEKGIPVTVSKLDVKENDIFFFKTKLKEFNISNMVKPKLFRTVKLRLLSYTDLIIKCEKERLL
jgi:hypothetical protein